eukprot:scaffold148909_cov55-Cyclotella_meneghiniana.AAC.4
MLNGKPSYYGMNYLSTLPYDTGSHLLFLFHIALQADTTVDNVLVYSVPNPKSNTAPPPTPITPSSLSPPLHTPNPTTFLISIPSNNKGDVASSAL